MDRARAAAVKQPSSTPITDGARFTITPLDVGSEAVRPGMMADVEAHRQALFVAAKIVLQRHNAGQSTLDAVSQHALDTAVRIAEAQF